MTQAACCNQRLAGVCKSIELPFFVPDENYSAFFHQEILKVAERPDIISFAGGLPNAELFATGDLVGLHTL